MIVEYTFVTTTPVERAMHEAVRFVRSLGFGADRYDATSFVARRGNHRPSAWATLDDLPQAIAVTFDRGRVELAVSLATPGKDHPIYRQRVLLIAEMVEAAIRPDRDLHKVVPRWNVHRLDGAEFRRKQVNRRIATWVSLGVSLFLLIIAIFSVAVVLEA